jgi:hypothetical protein
MPQAGDALVTVEVDGRFLLAGFVAVAHLPDQQQIVAQLDSPRRRAQQDCGPQPHDPAGNRRLA